jgi:hypothetical protein
MVASIQGNLDVVCKFVDLDTSSVNAKDVKDYKYTALMWTSYYNDNLDGLVCALVKDESEFNYQA